MNIYIKSFNRPFYLDRCIRSVKFNVKNYDKIIILEDGTLSKYVTKLRELHPDVEWRFSGADDMKFELLRQEKFNEIKKKYIEPAHFWIKELEKEEDDYFFLLEDDVWIVQNIDLNLLRTNMMSNDCIILKFWWNNNPQEDQIVKTYATSNNSTIAYFNPLIENVKDIYKVWIVAFAIYRKEYWLTSLKKINRMGDEHSQLLEAYEFIKNNPNSTFAKSKNRVVHQGWVIPGRATAEYYDKGLVQHLFMDALNEAWYNNKLDPNQGYPFDFSDDYIISILSQHLPKKSVDIWKNWKKNDIVYSFD